MFHNLAQPSSTIPSHRSSPALEPQLPRGECGFLLPEVDGRGVRLRCQCRSFFASDEIVRSLCGCGHQAWHHEAQPLSSVSFEEHQSVVQELQRVRRDVAALEQRFVRECKRHTEVERTWNTLHTRQYENMKALKVDLDDKVESVMDKMTEHGQTVGSLTKRVDLIDDLTMDFENRLDRLDPGGGRQSRSLTPVLEAPLLEKSIEEPMPDIRRELPIRIQRRVVPSTWSARVVFIPRKSQRYVPEHESVATQRCLSRGLQQEVTFSGTDSTSFVNTIESAFRQCIRARSWMPLIGYRPPDEPFGRMMLHTLGDEQLDKNKWDQAFIDNNCIAHDKLLGDLLYIALMNDDLSWTEIKWLPSVAGANDACWQHNEDLDGPTGKGNFKSLDEQMMYDYSNADPPPYSSRTQSEASRRISGLDVLANVSALHPLANKKGESSSLRSYSERSLSEVSLSAHSVSGVSERSLPASSLDSIMSDDDHHRDKKPRTKASLPSLVNASSCAGSTAPSLYVSGRSKRKLSNNTKVKEPLHINVSSWAPMRTIRSMQHNNKDKQNDAQSR